jgi:hypothetical protein
MLVGVTSGIKDGTSALRAASSAQAIKTLTGTNTDGVYWIDLPTVGPTQVYCIMNSSWNGGGWMMAMKATRGTTFNYSANYWSTTNTLNPTDLTRNDANAKYDVFNYFSALDIMAAWPDIGAGGSIPSVGMWTWLENNFNNSTRITPVNFFGNETGTYTIVNPGGKYGGFFKGLAKSFAGWGTTPSDGTTLATFSSQNAINFYGFNFYPHPQYSTQAKVRWGFGWNENGEGNYSSPATLASGAAPGSNDVSGGIGMDTAFGSHSAGDIINCCSDRTGINRSARVEIYVR